MPVTLSDDSAALVKGCLNYLADVEQYGPEPEGRTNSLKLQADRARKYAEEIQEKLNSEDNDPETVLYHVAYESMDNGSGQTLVSVSFPDQMAHIAERGAVRRAVSEQIKGTVGKMIILDRMTAGGQSE